MKSALATPGIRSAKRKVESVLIHLTYSLIVFVNLKFFIQLKLFPAHKVERIIKVRTDDISHWLWMGKHKIPSFIQKKFYMDGTWDLKKRPVIPDLLECSVPFKSTYQIFKEGIPYQNCPQYKIMKKNLDNKEMKWKWKNCNSIQEINESFEKLISAYKSIKQSGYKEQTKLGGNPLDEIKVVIDRNGNPIKVQGGGDHRFAIARILNIKEVPVHVVGVHYLWLRKCYEQYGGDILSAVNNGLRSLDVRYGKCKNTL